MPTKLHPPPTTLPSPFGGEFLYVYITITYFKSKGKPVWLRNHHMCKKGLEKKLTQLLYGCLARLRLLNQLHYLAAHMHQLFLTL
jgi:hypothetical protein